MSRAPSRYIPQWDAEQGDYLYIGNDSKQVTKIDRDPISHAPTFTFADGSTHTAGQFNDVELDTWDDD